MTTLEVEAYDEPAVLGYLQQAAPDAVERHVADLREHGIESSYKPSARPQPAAIPLCPSVQMRAWDEAPTTKDKSEESRAKSELRQWPVQLHLVPTQAPFYQGTNLTLVADCVPFANPNMHADLLRDSAIAVGCPKLDDGNVYVSKVAQILANNDVRSLKVAYMEVPCCRGLVMIAAASVSAQRQGHSVHG